VSDVCTEPWKKTLILSDDVSFAINLTILLESVVGMHVIR